MDLNTKQIILFFFSILIFLSPLFIIIIYCIIKKYKHKKIISKYQVVYNRLEQDVDIINL